MGLETDANGPDFPDFMEFVWTKRDRQSIRVNKKAQLSLGLFSGQIEW